jgi:hypothetical protein
LPRAQLKDGGELLRLPRQAQPLNHSFFKKPFEKEKKGVPNTLVQN